MNILNEIVKGASRQFGREFGRAGANAILKGKERRKENQGLPRNWAHKCHLGLFNENDFCSFACSALISKQMTIQPLILWTVLKLAIPKQEKRNRGLPLS